MVLKYLIQKEFKQMFRNAILPKVFIALPIVLVTIVPLIATQEIKDLKFCVVDNDHSSLSTRLIQKIDATSFFNLQSTASSYNEAMKNIDAGNADVILEIQPDFERCLISEGVSNVMVSANSVNGVKGSLGSSYMTQIIADFSAQLRDEAGQNGKNVKMANFDVTPRYLYNTTLDYKLFMIPALIGMLLILLVGFLPALNIVGEKEKGTIEQINVTPVGRMEFIFSKLVPYWTVGLFEVCFSMLLAYLVYGFYPAGGAPMIILFACLFVLVVSSFGLIVSNYSDTTQQAALTMFFFLVIFLLMSGLLTPISSMPDWAQYITYANPLRYFVEGMRSTYMKGGSFSEMMPYIYTLSAFAVITGTWAIWSYKKSN